MAVVLKKKLNNKMRILSAVGTDEVDYIRPEEFRNKCNEKFGADSTCQRGAPEKKRRYMNRNPT